MRQYCIKIYFLKATVDAFYLALRGDFVAMKILTN